MSRLKELHNSLVQHYQPVVGLRDLRATRFEALVRSADGSISAQQIISDFESNGGIQILDAWSLVSAISASRASGALVGVNISAESMCSRSFSKRVDTILKASTGARIALELTETQPLTDIAAARSFVAMAHDNGIRVGLDDFGDGHAELETIEALNLDFLKLSSQLTTGIGAGVDAEEIIHHAVAIAKARCMTVVGEHIETTRQLTWLRDVGVDLGQGWLFAKASPLIEMGRSYEAEAFGIRHAKNLAIA